MKRHSVLKSYRLDRDKVSKAKKALNVTSEAEAVRMAIEMVIDDEETMTLARKIMNEQCEALRELATRDREIKSDPDRGAQQPAVSPKQSKRATGKFPSIAELSNQEHSVREDLLSGAVRGGKENCAGKRNNQ